MHARHILTILRKDLRDAIRDSRVLAVLVIPLAIGLLYNFMFQPGVPRPSVTVAVAASGATTLPERLRAAMAPVADVSLRTAASADEARALVHDRTAEVALIVPVGFDAAVKSGQAPGLVVLRAEGAGTGASYALAALDGVLRAMAGQQPPAVLSVQSVATSQTGFLAVFQALGLRTYFTLASVLMLVAMIAMLAVPMVLGEEREKKTLDALVLVASYREVVAAKALLGIAYLAVGVPLLLLLTRSVPRDLLTFGAATLLLGIALTGIGLLLGGLFTPNQINTWGGILILPLILPPFLMSIGLPGFVEQIFLLLPSTHAMQLILNSASGTQFYPNTWVSYLTLVIWGVAAYAVLLWRLSRREA